MFVLRYKFCDGKGTKAERTGSLSLLFGTIGQEVPLGVVGGEVPFGKGGGAVSGGVEHVAGVEFGLPRDTLGQEAEGAVGELFDAP